jgi:hypothetical protein
MDYLIIFIFGFVTGWLVLRTIVQYRVKQVKDILMQTIEKSMPEEVMITFSKEGDLIQVHNSATQEFLAQGSTKEEIVQILEDRWPNKVFRASSKNMEEMGLK